jgi:transcriptional regulator with GAF, ATPase, and Fis domain
VREDSSAASVWPFIETLAAGERLETAAVDLCRLVLAGSGAERVLLAFVRAHDQIERAFGADLDGLAIGECTKRVPLDLVNQALARSEPIYHRELETLGGRGSILAVSAPAIHGSLRSVVIAEHRFSPARFDEVSEARAREWATLAQLLVRLSSTDGRPADAAHDEPEPPSETALELESSTSLPARGSGRAFTSIVGSSPVLRSALARLEAALATDLPLLIVGETGVGKELFARAVHDHGPRKGKPFIAVNCAAIPETLFEAELFGHAKGSFTGAERTRPGLLARAEGGTLLLDEVGELPISRQAVLLRALESGAYRPVGSDSEHRFDVRIVSATNRDLKQAAAKREFRPDLLYRLNVLEVRVPPLRERSDDVVPLVRHFLARHTGIADMPISPSALEALQTHDWPGNVRELEHCVQRLTAAGLTRIDLAHLPREIRAAAKARPRRPLQRASQRERTGSQVDERGQVASALQAVGGNISRAAARLGLTRHGLKKKMLRLGIRAEGGPGPGRPPASTRAVPATRARPRRQRSGE